MKIKSPYPKSIYKRNAGIYRMMGNPKRLEILNCIKDQEATTDELSEVLGIRKANTSQHLAVLRRLKVVTVRRSGKHMYYKISDPILVEPCRILNNLWGS